MKKLFPLLAALVLFAGCLGGEEDTSPEGNDTPTENNNQEDPNAGGETVLPTSFTDIPEDGVKPAEPEEVFARLASAQRTRLADNVRKELLPDAAITPTEGEEDARESGPSEDFSSKENFELTGSFTMPELGGEMIEFAMSFEGNARYGEDPAADFTFDLSGSAGSQGSGSVSGGFILVDEAFYGQVADVTLNVPGMPSEMILGPFQPFFETWYQLSLSDIENLTGEAMDPADLMQNPQKITNDVLRIIENTELWTQTEALPSEKGYYRFEVELNETALMSATEDIFDAVDFPEPDRTQILRELQEGFDEIEVTGTMAISAEHPEYFTFEGQAVSQYDTIDINVEVNAEMVEVFVSPVDEEEAIVFQSEKSGATWDYSLVLQESEESITLMDGSYGASIFSVSLYDDYNGEELFALDLAKSGEAWAGSLSVPEDDIVIAISNLVFKNEGANMQVSGDFGITQGGQEMGSFGVSYTVEEVENVSISAPADYKTFEQLMEEMQSLQAAFGGAPAGSYEDMGEPVLVE